MGSTTHSFVDDDDRFDKYDRPKSEVIRDALDQYEKRQAASSDVADDLMDDYNAVVNELNEVTEKQRFELFRLRDELSGNRRVKNIINHGVPNPDSLPDEEDLPRSPDYYMYISALEEQLMEIVDVIEIGIFKKEAPLKEIVNELGDTFVGGDCPMSDIWSILVFYEIVIDEIPDDTLPEKYTEADYAVSERFRRDPMGR